MITFYKVFTPCVPSSNSSEMIVLIHGLNGNSLTWNDVAQPLSDSTGLPVFTFDQPGHGHNADIPAESLEAAMQPKALAKALHEVLVRTTTNTMRFHVFGQSYGSRTAVAFAALYPKVTLSVALGDIGIKPCPTRNYEAAWRLSNESRAKHPPRNFETEEECIEYVSRDGPGGDNYTRKYCKEEDGTFRALVRPYVGYVHEYICRNVDLSAMWEDFEGHTLVLRANREKSCIGDDEWGLMQELRRENGIEKGRIVQFIRTVGDHGVHRSHPVDWVNLYSAFLLKCSSVA
eukprot:PhF_6_TR22716/c0_g1_i1/m.32361